MEPKTDDEQCKCIDYQNMYEKALERAKLMLTMDMPDICRHTITDIFPVLKKSKDERICDEIKGALLDRPEKTPTERLEWLEEQTDRKRESMEIVQETPLNRSKLMLDSDMRELELWLTDHGYFVGNSEVAKKLRELADWMDD